MDIIRNLNPREREAVTLAVLKTIHSGSLRVSGSDDNSPWERGWGEILSDIRANGFDVSKLKPQYFANDPICRIHGDYVHNTNPFDYDQSLRNAFFTRHLQDETRIVELGCGTGLNQMMLASLFPDASLVAADWSKAALEIIRHLSSCLDRAIAPVSFNMLTLEGWDDLGIDSNTCVLTVHALEQLGGDWGLLLTALRKAKPRLCVHIEPFLELYDEDTIFDYLAATYHRTRNYLTGWLPAIRELEKQGKADILHVERTHFGNRYHDAYSLLVWMPT